MTWLTGYSYRKSHEIHAATGAGANYQIKITVHAGAGTDSVGDVYLNSHGVDASFGDIRFTDDDGSTELDYWMESHVDSDNAVFWVEVKDSLETNPQTIYIYYGKASTSTTSSGINTFIFFEDFNALNDGELVGQNNWTGNTGKYVVETTTKQEGAKAVQVTAIQDYAYQALTIDGSKLFVQSYLRASIIANLWTCIFKFFEGTTEITGVALAGSKIKHYSDVDWEDIVNASSDTWYKVKVALTSASTHKIWIDDVEKTLTHTGNYANVITAVTKIGLQQYTFSGTPVSYWDLVIVGKYVSPEPVQHTWGSEEVPPTTYNQSCTQTLTSTGANPLFNIKPLKTQSFTSTPVNLCNINLNKVQTLTATFTNPLFNIKPLKEQTLSISDSRLLNVKSLLIQSLTGVEIFSFFLEKVLEQIQHSDDSFSFSARKVSEEISSFTESIFSSFLLNLQSSLKIVESLFFKASSFLSELLGVSELNNFSSHFSLSEGFTFLDFFSNETRKNIEDSLSIFDFLLSSFFLFFSETMDMVEETLQSFLYLLLESLKIVETKNLVWNTFSSLAENMLHSSEIRSLSNKVIEATVSLEDKLSDNFLLQFLEYFLIGEIISDTFTKLEESSHSFVSALLLEIQLERGEALSLFDFVTSTLAHLLSIQVEDFLSFTSSISFSGQIVLDELLQLIEMISKKVSLSVKSTFSFFDSVATSFIEALHQEVNELLSSFPSIHFSSLAFLEETSSFIETTSKRFSFYLQSVLSFLSSVSNFKFIGLLLPEILTTFDSALSFSVRKILQNIMNLDSQVKSLSRRILVEGFAFLDIVGIFRFLTIVREIRILLRNTPVYTKLKNYYTRIRKRDFGND